MKHCYWIEEDAQQRRGLLTSNVDWTFKGHVHSCYQMYTFAPSKSLFLHHHAWIALNNLVLLCMHVLYSFRNIDFTILVFGLILQNFFNEHKIPTREIASTYVNNGSINGAMCFEHKKSNSMLRMYPFGRIVMCINTKDYYWKKQPALIWVHLNT